MEDLGVRRWEIAIKLIAVTLLVLALALSATVGDNYFSDPAHYPQTLSSLQDKEEKIVLLTGSCATAATLLAAVPDDTTTPVASELADLASMFAIVLSVIFIEKYSLTLIGHVVFNYLFPAVCISWIAGIILNKRFFKRWAIKLGIFGVIICMAIPFAMDVADLIEKTSDYKIEQTIAEAEGISNEINENKDEEGNFFTKAWKKLTGGISGLMDRASHLLSNAMETAAVLLATSCIIPIAVVLVMTWVIKLLFGVQIYIPTDLSKRLSRRISRRRAKDDDHDDAADD